MALRQTVSNHSVTNGDINVWALKNCFQPCVGQFYLSLVDKRILKYNHLIRRVIFLTEERSEVPVIPQRRSKVRDSTDVEILNKAYLRSFWSGLRVRQWKSDGSSTFKQQPPKKLGVSISFMYRSNKVFFVSVTLSIFIYKFYPDPVW